jgi:hypothetical protein
MPTQAMLTNASTSKAIKNGFGNMLLLHIHKGYFYIRHLYHQVASRGNDDPTATILRYFHPGSYANP